MDGQKKARLVLLVIIVVAVLTVFMARQAVAKPSPLIVAAASDLRPAFEAIGALFEKSSGQQVVFVFGSSGTLSQQIAAGAPYDVFASADPAYIDTLQQQGRVLPATRGVFARGRIVLAVRSGTALHLQKLDDLMQPPVRTVSIANPDYAPYGAAGRQALQAAGLWEKVQGRVVYADNASTSVRFVQTGDADAGIVALSLAKDAGLDYALIDSALYDPLQQTIIALSDSKQERRVREFIAVVNSPQGRQILSDYGYLPPGDR
jgi:molybdate transport system substrate-binding protein